MKIVKSFLIALILALTGFGLASVAYSGPDRTVTTTTWERQSCNYRATVTSPSGTCFLTLYFSPGSCPAPASVADYFNNASTACGTSWPGTCGAGLSCNIALLTGSTQGCSNGETGCTQITHTSTYPPATVSGTTACAVPGNSGWCRETATIDLSGNEPMGGYSITGIEGSAGMLCSGPACTWTFPDGVTNLDFWALSSWGDSSTLASAVMKMDGVAPSLTLTIPPADGLNDWFRSGPVTASASATDLTSGISGTASINGGGPIFTTSADGTYNLTAVVSDIAGNTTSTSEKIRLDTTPPNLTVSVPPADGLNGWHISPFSVIGSGSDTTSGLSGLQYRLDGEPWISGDSVGVPEGVHGIEFEASDVAGNRTTVSNTISLDVTPPSMTVSVPAVDGSNGWYISPVTLTSTSVDTLSGLFAERHRLDGGAWEDGTRLTLSDGIHVVDFQASDLAGNQATNSYPVSIDATPPQSTFTSPAEGSRTFIHGSFIMTGHTLDLTSGPSTAEISKDGGNTWLPLVIADGNWFYAWDTSTVPDGTYIILIRASDVAGNKEISAHITVVVANQGPQVTIAKNWWLWEQAEVSILGTILPVTGARITISDGQGHTRRYNFDAGILPSSLKWDGKWDDGLFAPPGDFAVLVTAWDAFGNTGQDSGTVHIPQPLPTPTRIQPTVPAQTPQVIPASAATTVLTLIPQKTATAPASVADPVPTPVPVLTQSSPIQPAIDPVYIWPVIGLVGLLAAFSSSSWSDKRPSALHRLERSLMKDAGLVETKKWQTEKGDK